MTPNDIDVLPTSGGRYIRKPDGSLERDVLAQQPADPAASELMLDTKPQE